MLAVQLLVLYGLFAFAGLRLARACGLQPAPELTAIWERPAQGDWRLAGVAFAIGLGCGVLLITAVAAIRLFLPGTFPQMLHPPGIVAALLSSAAGSLGEEILFRLFGLSLLLRLLPEGKVGSGLAVSLSALAFAAAHAPAAVFLFGGWQRVPPISWAWMVGLNGLLGITFGMVFLRAGVVCAVLAHLGTDMVWHAASQLSSA